MIDINQPVEHGHDMVINFEDGSSVLGTGAERETAVANGEVIGEHTNSVPVSQDEVVDEVTVEDAPVAKPKRRKISLRRKKK